MKDMGFLQESRNGSCRLRVYLQPRASANKICGIHGEALKIRITAPPVDGQANGMIIKFIAKLLKVPKSAVQVSSGQQNRNKTLTISAKGYSEISKILAAAIKG